MQNTKQYTYMTLLTNNTYIQGVLLLNNTLNKVKSQYPLTVLVTDDVASETLDILNFFNIKWKKIETITFPQHIQNFINQSYEYYAFNPLWYNIITKFQIFNQIEYDKIIYLDCDIMVLKNIDHLFQKPHMSATKNFNYYKNLRKKSFKNWKSEEIQITSSFALQNDNEYFNAGFLVIKPSIKLFNNLINFIENLDINNLPKDITTIHEEIILNLYYSNWQNQSYLHLNEYYNVFYFANLKIGMITKDLKDNAYFIHFYGSMKPWDLTNKLFKNKANIDKSYVTTAPLYYDAINIIEKELLSLPINLLTNFSKIYLEEINK